MNDFTKEELEQLISDINNIRIYTDIDNWDDELHTKIQFMIENYCEHDTCGGEIEEFIDICAKCKAFLLREAYHGHE